MYNLSSLVLNQRVLGIAFVGGSGPAGIVLPSVTASSAPGNNRSINPVASLILIPVSPR
jgi:hypothetical protein